ncbi:unnamed protein product [Blepharisma stoltei]|uniref:Palmitoyltransferase n=1 Tax=Blepharisma stoltei TaxID=1481888 RepID=A0AAU9JIM9_9CILI|nr:unnamed protein product [Blepharisma stoltei]
MWFIKDGAGIACVVLTYLIMTGVSSLVIKVAILQLDEEEYINGPICICFYYFFLFLAGFSHLKAMLTDPGSVPLNSAELPKVNEYKDGKPKFYCLRCRCNKPSRCHHCSTCGRCIMKMDHHCPWVNNCVGHYNQKHFVLFLLYIELSCIYSFIMLGMRASYCFSHEKAELCLRPRQEVSFDLFIGVLSFFMAGIFGLFVGVMMQDQLTCIINNTSGIDELKKTLVEKRPVKVNLEETFGGPFGILWFIPTSLKRQSNDMVEIELT